MSASRIPDLFYSLLKFVSSWKQMLQHVTKQCVCVSSDQRRIYKIKLLYKERELIWNQTIKKDTFVLYTLVSLYIIRYYPKWCSLMQQWDFYAVIWGVKDRPGQSLSRATIKAAVKLLEGQEIKSSPFIFPSVSFTMSRRRSDVVVCSFSSQRPRAAISNPSRRSKSCNYRLWAPRWLHTQLLQIKTTRPRFLSSSES